MRKLLMIASLAFAVAVAAAFWFVRQDASPGEARAADGVVRVEAPAAVESPLPAIAPTRPLPALPDKMVAQVRQAYPLLTDVDFACDTGGCAVTATIPPPTGEAFLEKRQEMLLGGLARTIEANGYKAQGPVKIDEVAFNTFRLRASVAPGK